MAQYRVDQSVDFRDHESITVAASSVGLTASKYNPTNLPNMQYALITVETDQVRCYFDATAADSNGHLFNVGDVIELEGSNNLAGFRAIRVTASATLRVSYGR